ncbi:glycosyltransferase [Foetidibacter luteolus]|uniref:glycosyltransferase n=1 Tax=Foetidibacter luteolus TaxID=2608880 RepID=UPI00129A75EE|nr:glycosyltransferase [Foetidibacter luteolus]
MGCKVSIATDGPQLSLLQHEFPQLDFLVLKGYNVVYATNKRFLPVKILQQAPKILKKIRAEHAWLQRIILEKGIDLVISDNRFGLYTRLAPCIFITHQLQIQAPYRWLQNIIQKINYKYINRFTECWVSDREEQENIAGNLSHPRRLPAIPVRYLGILSRFDSTVAENQKYDWLIALSGPEPQRTLLEEKVLAAAAAFANQALLVRGKPGETGILPKAEGITIVNHLAGRDMERAFRQAKFIICRSGYTTIMELVSLQKKAMLIPTPGQTEQEYLAKRLMEQGWFFSCNQHDDLLQKIKDAQSFNYTLPELPKNRLEEILKNFLEKHTTPG